MAVIKKENSYMEFPLQISRQYGAPIDKYSVFYTKAEATTYATTSPLAYVGQIISVVDEANSKSILYIINDTAGTLVEVGATAPMIFVANEAEMLALTDIEAGQQVYREDTNSIWIFKGGDASQLSNWAQSAADNSSKWEGTSNKVIFQAITQANYDNITNPDENTIYFVTDTGRIYKGAIDVTSSVIATTNTLPEVANAIANKIYVTTDDLALNITTDNTVWYKLSPGYLTDGNNWAEADGNKLATIALIKSGIQEAISAITTALSFAQDTGIVTVNDKTAVLTSVAHGITYDSALLKITVPQYGAEDLVINIPKDKFVTAGKYYENYPETNPTHHNVIVLTIDNQDDPVIIPAEALVNIYTADNTGKNLVVSISDNNEISAQLILDPDTKNALTYSDKGFLVDISGKLDKLTGALGQKLIISSTDGTISESGYGIQSTGALTDSTSEVAVNKVIYDALAKKANAISGTANDIVSIGADGKSIKDSGIKVGADTLAETPNSTTLATELAVKTAVEDAAITWSPLA